MFSLLFFWYLSVGSIYDNRIQPENEIRISAKIYGKLRKNFKKN